ncbi:hypothetical protein Aperf_G00000045221 [Anoplocephala perfoliata]
MSSKYIQLGKFEYNPADVLGNGAFAIVYKGRFRNDKSRKVAIKQMTKGQNVDKSKNLLSKEISVLTDLNHEHIVRLYDHCVNENDVYLVMEFCNGGDLSDYLHRKKTLPEETIRHFLIQIGSAMDAMNRKAIVHRDLKPGNILLSYYGNYSSVEDVPGPLITFKLADFGFARFLRYGSMAQTMCGSPMYMAPEVLMCQKYDARADIWSMGIIVYQCYVGKAPFYANSPEALKNIYLKTVDLKPKIPRETSPELRDLLLKMLVRKASERIDFPSFLSHPFLTTRHVSPSDLVPHTPATVPPLPSSVRRLRGAPPSTVPNLSTSPSRAPFSHSGPRRTNVAHRPTYSTAAPRGRGRSAIAELMPTVAVRGALRRGLSTPTGKPGTLSPPPPPRSPLDNVNVEEEDSSESSLTPTEDGDEFIEDGLGGSSFLGEARRPYVPLSTEGFSALDPCLTEVLQRPGPLASNIPGRYQLHAAHAAPSMDRSLEGYVIVETNGTETGHSRGIRPSPRHPGQLPRRGDVVPSGAYHITSASPSSDDKSHIPRKLNSIPNGKTTPGMEAHYEFDPKSPTRQSRSNAHLAGIKSPPNQTGIPPAPAVKSHALHQISSEEQLLTKEEAHSSKKGPDIGEKMALKRSQLTPISSAFEEAARTLAVQIQAARNVGVAAAPAGNEVMDERLRKQHDKEMETMTMVLELCELLAELAERRASALTDCTTTTTTVAGTAKGEENSASSSPPLRATSPTVSNDVQSLPTTKLKLVPEAKRIVEQLVLYRRILYYLEYVFGQVRKAVEENRMQPTPPAKKRLQDCNALYHRCYIRLCQLWRLSRRDDLLEPVGRYLSRITANRLIFNYALDQCFAAEMDDYIGELGLALQRYRAAITLIHGLCQHATTEEDKSLLTECLHMIQERYAILFDYVTCSGAGGGPRGDETDSSGGETTRCGFQPTVAVPNSVATAAVDSSSR